MEKQTLINLKKSVQKNPTVNQVNKVMSYISSHDENLMCSLDFNDVFDTKQSVETLSNLGDTGADLADDEKDINYMKASNCNWFHTGAIPVMPKELIQDLNHILVKWQAKEPEYM